MALELIRVVIKVEAWDDLGTVHDELMHTVMALLLDTIKMVLVISKANETYYRSIFYVTTKKKMPCAFTSPNEANIISYLFSGG